MVISQMRRLVLLHVIMAISHLMIRCMVNLPIKIIMLLVGVVASVRGLHLLTVFSTVTVIPMVLPLFVLVVCLNRLISTFHPLFWIPSSMRPIMAHSCETNLFVMFISTSSQCVLCPYSACLHSKFVAMYKSIPVDSYEPQAWPKLLKHVVVDQSYSQDFALNEFGHIRSDISQLFAAQSEEQVAAILKRLADVPASPDTKGLSDSEIISQIVPRNCQSPAQISSFMLRLQAAADSAKQTVTPVAPIRKESAPPDGGVSPTSD